ncbi:MAG: serine/threonine-protein kinase [Candidatus Margulisiibacteriota bacterium]
MLPRSSSHPVSADDVLTRIMLTISRQLEAECPTNVLEGTETACWGDAQNQAPLFPIPDQKKLEIRQGPQLDFASAVPGQAITKRYIFERILGKGGLGFVYLLKDKQTGKEFAIKTLNDTKKIDPQAIQTEVETLRCLAGQPNIVRYLDCWRDPSDQIYLVMEYIEGQSIRQFVNERVDFSEYDVEPDPNQCNDYVVAAMHIIKQIAIALEAAHNAGELHLDLSPENILLQREEVSGNSFYRITVLDFLGRYYLEKRTEWLATSRNGDVRPSIGKIPYMSPEQARFDAVDQRSDIFSLGLLFYYMLVGQRPFDDLILEQHQNANVEKLGRRSQGVAFLLPIVPWHKFFKPNSDLGIQAFELIQKMTTARPEDRQSGHRELIEEIDAILAAHNMIRDVVIEHSFT